ncbi:potassium transporter 5-like [Durio zibethinus]|uniref:Potassium transporter n=1 Tax=Durio zibethinus TaxID=66656 RepID=A0A6P5ZZZ7_DURZI|nr:potassium transporter 5-like [Durio zibethinus]
MSSAIVEEGHAEVVVAADSEHQLEGNNPSLGMTDVAAKAPARQDSAKWSFIFNLAFQSIGIIYGDIGTSPLYVFSSTFTNGINHRDDILGVLSLILYTLTLIPLVKYVFIVLRATDNGEGGTFAMYSLICRYAKVSLIPSQQAEDREVSNFKLELPGKRLKLASGLKSVLENSQFAKIFLLIMTMLGTSMVIGDSVFTPCISVLSAVGGIKQATSAITEDMIVGISIAILICLFMFQRFGTGKVGYSFAPILCIWFALISGIGVYNIIKHDPTVVKAINPKYIVNYFMRNKKDAWISLGGVVLCTTGAEALFADVGHFSVLSIRISMCSVTFPALILAYTGQAAFLRKHQNSVSDAFYASLPGRLHWPMFGVSILASVIASQAMISGTFSIIHQSLSLGCFPRVKVVHTSANHEGQVYIPEVNYLLMLACVCVTAGFKTTEKIGNAYGVAVVFVMTLTSSLLVLIMIMIWKTNIFLVISYILIIGSVELLYLTSVLHKFIFGGYLPLAFSAVLMTIMYIWNDVYRRKYLYELEHKISPARLKEISTNKNLCRIPGIALFYSELVQGIPPIFEHYVSNVPALHSILVFVSIKSLPINKVPDEERFFFRRVEPRELLVYQCVVRYGYKEVKMSFEEILVRKLKEFQEETFMNCQIQVANENTAEKDAEFDGGLVHRSDEHDDEMAKQFEEKLQEIIVQQEIEVDKAWEAGGIVHFVGESEVIASKEASMMKRILIDYAYNFLKKNLRQSQEVFDIPHKRMLKVGMTYQL